MVEEKKKTTAHRHQENKLGTSEAENANLCTNEPATSLIVSWDFKF